MNKQTTVRKTTTHKKSPAGAKFATKATAKAKVPGQRKDIPAAPDFEAQLIALRSNHAVLEMKMDGTIVYANEIFLKLSGYTFDEMVGAHYGDLVDDSVRNSGGYANFWAKVQRGECQTLECKQIYKNGVEVWLHASFNPILDLAAKPTKLFMYASDITVAKQQQADAISQLKSISNYQAVIEFKLDGTIITANQNFLDATGYTLGEVQGRHHSIFVDAEHKLSNEYRLFWDGLGRGRAEAGQYRRVRRDGSEVWLQASYNPILDVNGRPYKVIKYASDITKQKQAQAEADSQLRSISTYQAVIEFKLDGTIVTANQNFLDTIGYTLAEIQGRHHSMFVDNNYKQTNEYRLFWEKLGRGEADAGQYKRFKKDGSEVWLQASYNPIFDLTGKPFKVIKYASDITQQKRVQTDADNQLKSISKYQAVIEFKLDGTIATANQNFLDTMGYTLAEIQGRHHSLFVDNAYKQTNAYRQFWDKLGRGEAESGQYKRVRRDGAAVWLQASYNPIFDLEGRPHKVIKYATDITKQREAQTDADNQLKSISKYQGVIEFKLDGTIVNANQNFLDATGYTLGEITGRHHSIFVEQAYKQSNDYRLFWDRLGRGEADAGQYKRIRRNGTEVWLQASYNPILDLEGHPCKVIKYATDITEQKIREQQMIQAMAETSRVMAALASGDLSQSVQGTFDGEFGVLRDAVNGCVTELKKMITETSMVMKEVAAGDLRKTIQQHFEGEFGSLRDSVNSCIDHLRTTVERIRHSVSTMTVSSSEIATGNLDLSQRTEQQAASLSTTAGNMQEITQTVKQNADNAREANSLATGARQQAEKGGAVVTNAIAAMGAINDASKRIADIIGVIDEIAFQTNLLALNAAVEAARAGEQGRGFAVVASEVRNLAQRSAGAAKEIKSLIKDSVVRVEEGSRLVNESGATLEQIVNAAKKVSDIIAEIAAASTQQSSGIEKVTEAIQQMDVAVQQNSALVEETSAASNMMDDQTRSMSTLIEFFKISDNEAAFGAIPKKENHTKGKYSAKTPPKRFSSPAPSFDRSPDFAMSEEF